MTDDRWRFLFRARFLDVRDGDTIEMLLDRGMKDYAEVAVRVRDLWCPEPGTWEGEQARKAADDWHMNVNYATSQSWPFLVELHKQPRAGEETKSFDRYVGDIYDEDLNSFAAWMIEHGHGTATR